MKVFTCIDHNGVYPVGVASVVVSENEQEARMLLDAVLIDHKLALDANDPYTLQELDTDKPVAKILRDGNY